MGWATRISRAISRMHISRNLPHAYLGTISRGGCSPLEVALPYISRDLPHAYLAQSPACISRHNLPRGLQPPRGCTPVYLARSPACISRAISRMHISAQSPEGAAAPSRLHSRISRAISRMHISRNLPHAYLGTISRGGCSPLEVALPYISRARRLIKVYNSKADIYEQVVQQKGQPLREGFSVVKVRAARA